MQHSLRNTPDIERVLNHMGLIRSLARDLVRDAHAAEDLSQNTVLAFLNAQPSRSTRVESWIAGTVRNLARMRARTESRRQVREIAAARQRDRSDVVEDALEHSEIKRELVSAALELKDPYRIAIVLRYFEDMTPKEIAHTLGLPLNTVKAHLSRGLSLLRQRLDGQHPSRAAWVLALTPIVFDKTIRGSQLALTAKFAASILVVAVSVFVFQMLDLGDQEIAFDDSPEVVVAELSASEKPSPRRSPAQRNAKTENLPKRTALTSTLVENDLGEQAEKAKESGLTFNVVVVDQENNEPLPKTRVRMRDAGTPTASGGTFGLSGGGQPFDEVDSIDWTLTDAQGVCSKTTAHPETELCIEREGYVTIPWHRVIPGPDETIRLAMAKSSDLHLKRASDSEGHLYIFFSRVGEDLSSPIFFDMPKEQSTKTISSLAKGTYGISVTQIGRESYTLHRRFYRQVTIGDSSQTIEFFGRDGFDFDVELLDFSSPEKMTVSLRKCGRTIQFASRSGSCFHFESVEPGQYVIHANNGTRDLAVHNLDLKTQPLSPIKITAEESILQLQIEGLDTEDTTTQVWVEGKPGFDNHVSASMMPDGTYQIECLVPGEYEIWIRNLTILTMRKVTIGDRPQELTFHVDQIERHVLSVTLASNKALDGKLYVETLRGTRIGQPTFLGSRLARWNLPAGRYRACYFDNSGTKGKKRKVGRMNRMIVNEFDLSADQEIRLKPLARIKADLRITAAGLPLAHHSVTISEKRSMAAEATLILSNQNGYGMFTMTEGRKYVLSVPGYTQKLIIPQVGKTHYEIKLSR